MNEEMTDKMYAENLKYFWLDLISGFAFCIGHIRFTLRVLQGRKTKKYGNHSPWWNGLPENHVQRCLDIEDRIKKVLYDLDIIGGDLVRYCHDVQDLAPDVTNETEGKKTSDFTAKMVDDVPKVIEEFLLSVSFLRRRTTEMKETGLNFKRGEKNRRAETRLSISAWNTGCDLKDGLRELEMSGKALFELATDLKEAAK